MNRFASFRLSCQGLFSTREVLARKRLQTRLQAVQLHRPIKHEETNNDIAHPPRAQRPGITINSSTDMAWRPYATSSMENSTAFFRRDMTPLRVTFDLIGDFSDDIHGRRIRLTNPQPSE